MANQTTGGLIWRLIVLIGVQLVALLVAATMIRVIGLSFNLLNHCVAWVTLSASFAIAQILAEVPVTQFDALSRLAKVTAIRAGIPMVVVVLIDRMLIADFLYSILIYLFIGYLFGLIVGIVMTSKRLASN